MGILRYLLALSVLIDHSHFIPGVALIRGTLPVQAFFMISGFYMALMLREKYVGSNGSYKLFITNRFLRLYPPYLLCLTFILLIAVRSLIVDRWPGPLIYYFKHGAELGLPAWLLIVFSNLFIFGQDLIMFLEVSFKTGDLHWVSDFRKSDSALWSFLLIPQAWSVGLEMTFYLMAPFLFRMKQRALFFILAGSLALRGILYLNGFNHDPWTYRFLPTELAFFIAGYFSHLLYRRIRQRNLNKYVCAALYATFCLFLIRFEAIKSLGVEVKTCLFFLSLALVIPCTFHLTRNSRMDRWVGELSYPLYLCHLFLMYLLIPVAQRHGLNLATVTAIVSTALSAMIVNFLILPMERFRQSRVRPAARGVPVFETAPAG